jgi:hypothetical protein
MRLLKKTGSPSGVSLQRWLGDRGAAAGREPLQFAQPLVVRAAELERPELRRKPARRGLQQRRQIKMIGAEADAVLAQARSRRLVEALHLFGDLLPLEHAERLDDLEGDAAGDAGDVLGGGERKQRAEQPLDVGLEPEVEPRLHRVARRAAEQLVGDHAQPRTQYVIARAQLADRRADPAHGAVGVEHELALRRLLQLGGAGVDLAGQRTARGSLQRFCFGARRRRIGNKREPVETADLMPLNHNFAGLFDFSFQCRVLAQPPH